MCGHGSTVQSRDLRCLVGVRAEPDAGGALVGGVGGADASAEGVAFAFATTRTGALGIPAGAASRAGMGTGTIRAPAFVGVCTDATVAGACSDCAGASRHARGAGRVIRRRMARTDHTGRVRRSRGRASRAIATTRRRELACVGRLVHPRACYQQLTPRVDSRGVNHPG